MSPEAAFKKLKEGGGWWVILVIIVMLAAGTWLQMPIIHKTVHEQLQKAPVQGVSESSVLRIAEVGAYIGSIVSLIVIFFITGLRLKLVNALVQGEAKYMQLVKTAIYASIPGVIGALLTGILLRATDAGSINDIILSPAALLPVKKGILFVILNIFNPFSLWGLGLQVVGTKVMTGVRSGKVTVYVIVIWLILTVIGGLIGSR
ncbi:YIP1 family protein [Paenibacillus humicola]|uniref:YIP1 family protein n=1 Tax=Paenibacillus humicola TaxID=3110540 RepID=UPI00237A6EBC|nr:YIP1 family protein [Paenibacillus humicola]